MTRVPLAGSLLALTFLFVAGSAAAQEFRATTWMMSKDLVIASEGGRVVSELSQKGQQLVVFKTYVDGLPATITYILENDALLSASYTFARDTDRRAWVAMMQDLTDKNGPPAFEQDNLAGWRLEKTEIALAHLRDGTTQAAYWEKSYFARITHPPQEGTGRE
jgi:hypothetical protein